MLSLCCSVKMSTRVMGCFQLVHELSWRFFVSDVGREVVAMSSSRVPCLRCLVPSVVSEGDVALDFFLF